MKDLLQLWPKHRRTPDNPDPGYVSHYSFWLFVGEVDPRYLVKATDEDLPDPDDMDVLASRWILKGCKRSGRRLAELAKGMPWQATGASIAGQAIEAFPGARSDPAGFWASVVVALVLFAEPKALPRNFMGNA